VTWYKPEDGKRQREIAHLGFGCLVIWKKELKVDREQLICKLLSFEQGSKNST